MDGIDSSTEVPFNLICVRQLPPDVHKNDIARVFETFGTILNISVKRRIAKGVDVFLQNPFAIVTFEHPDTVDQIMAARPFSLDQTPLAVRRFVPRPLRKSYEPSFPVKKILVRTQSDHDDERLPEDALVVEYLQSMGGKIEYFQRLDEKTILIQFDDYDPVDLCCMMALHQINNQPIRIERCLDENQARRQAELRANSTVVPGEETNDQPAPVPSAEEQAALLQSQFNQITGELEAAHEQRVSVLTAEWKQMAKERIRFERLTLDYEQEQNRQSTDYRHWQKLYSDSLKEKAEIQREGERRLSELKTKSDH